MSVLTNLYPPIINTFMPAFLINSEDEEQNICKVYFSLSMYNDIDEIANAQVIVRDQNTNRSMLDKIQYPCEIKLTEIYEDESITNDYKYYIEIYKSDMQGGNFEVDQYYKVQIRFTGTDATAVSLETPQKIDGWLNLNLDYFSEWSTVCLIRGISVPTLEVQNFEPGATELINWSIANTQIIGKVTFADENETETLRSYRIKLFGADDKLLTDSGILYTTNSIDKNSFIYTIQYAYSINYRYKIVLEYTTSNYYSSSTEYFFQVMQQSSLLLDLTMTGETDPDNGRVFIKITKTNLKQNFTGKIIIRRSSSLTNFTIWEDVYIKNFENAKMINFSWYDYTIESGIWYNYAVQAVETNGLRGLMERFLAPCMIEFEHMYLTSENKQLKIAFNPKVASMKTVYVESKNNTLGSKFPIIRRNGNTEYEQFQISGMISSEMDEDGLFETKESIYGENAHYYDEYNQLHNIYSHSDYIYEKEFRNKVTQFLNENNLKLFRSPTEGNFMVRLTDISLTPQDTLGRRLWSFSATCNEMADYTVENLKKYNFIKEDNE